jgi:hypothetical protein
VPEICQQIDHVTPGVRLRRALELLVRHCEAEGGHLFLVRGEHVECVASLDEVVSAIELEEFVHSVRSMDTDLSLGVTATDLGLGDDLNQWGCWTSPTGAVYDPVPLYSSDEYHDGRAVGIAILRPKSDTLRRADPEFLSAIVAALADSGDLSNVRVR